MGKKGIHFGYLNVCSLWNKYNLIRPLIQSSGLDLIPFSETWLNDGFENSQICIAGYVCFRLDRSWMENNTIKRGGGVCCFIKNDICVTNSDLLRDNRSSKDMEIMWLSLSIPNCRNIIIGNIYRPPRGNVKTCTDTLDEMVQEISMLNRHSEIFILGDFNINCNTSTNPDTKLLKWFEQRSGLKQIINETTRFSNNNACIDLIFTNSPCIFE